jgi:hypothetical protein
MSKSTVNQPYRVFLADNFLQYYKEGDRPLYMAIGKSTAWPNPSPTRTYDTANESHDFISNLLAMKRVENTGIIPVIRNFKWESGLTDFVVFDTLDSDASYSKFYCVNSEGRIYACVGVGAGAVSEEPLGHNNGNDILTDDGYSWQYYYNVTPEEYLDYYDTPWIVMNFGPYASQEQVDYGNRYVNVAFGSNHVMVRTKLTDELIVGVDYYQIGLISLPHDLLDEPITEIYHKVSDLSYHQHVVYLENTYKLSRKIGKWEEIKIVLEF